MRTFLMTLVVAFGLFIISAALLAIGRLITGKSKLRTGMCGRLPTKKKGEDSSCGKDNSCGLCGGGKPNDEEEE